MKIPQRRRGDQAPGRPGAAERVARCITLGAVLALAVGLTLAVRAARRDNRTIDLVARQPSAGGWSRERIVVREGERVRLRIRSEDVVHGFAIGRLGVSAGRIEPGKVKTVEFVAGRPGEYTFYCTEWCDANHARMRGILEVRGQEADHSPPPASDVALSHLDAPRSAPVVPPGRPAASRGRELYGQDAGSGGRDLLVDRSPVEVFQALRQGAGVPRERGTASGWSDQATWDVVSYLWSLRTTRERLDAGRDLFARNCAACHGTGGAGDGPAGARQPKRPADFTDARRMLAGTSALYLAKIRRGGMGTGMPYWGSIFTEEELQALVDTVWSFSLGTRK